MSADYDPAPFVCYDSTGRILWEGTCQARDVERQTGPGWNVLAGDKTWDGPAYVDLSGEEPVIAPRAVWGLAYMDGKLATLPCRCHLVFSGPVEFDVVVDAGDHDVVFDLPGAYHVRVLCEDPAYMDIEMELVA